MEEQKDFGQMLEESMIVPDTGKVVKGTVVRVDHGDVFIDFGFKSEGIVPLDEFPEKNGEPTINVGDEVEVTLVNGLGEGVPKLSKKKAEFIREKERLRELYEKEIPITAKVVQRVKGGLLADVGENSDLRAFLPASQVDIRRRNDLKKFVGETVEAKIIQFSDDGLVISRRTHLEEQREIEREKTLAVLEEGQLTSGKVVNIIDQGVFVDIGGIEGFVPISELSWGRVGHPSDVVAVDDRIDVKVLKIENEDRITLSVKETTPDPWSFVDAIYEAGTKIEGKVVSITDFGAFVELEPGVDGLVHVSEMTWTKKFSHPKEIVSVGDVVETKILDIDSERQRISLSLREVQTNPWKVFKEENSPGTVVTGEIVNVNELGLFVEVSEGLVGLVRPYNISWGSEEIDPEEHYNEGEEIELVVLGVEEKEQKIALGVKQLTDDPWEKAMQMYKPNKTVAGKVSDFKPRGIVVELEDGIEGYIKSSELVQGGGTDLSKNYSIGDEIKAQVTGFDRKRRQINLSEKRLEKKVERERVSDFMSSQGDSTSKLGDVLGEKLKSLAEKE